MPKTKEQNEQIKIERYNRIISACAKLFSSNGFDSVTIDDIAKESDSSHGLLYHYFHNKEEAYNIMLTKIIDDFENVLKNVNFETCSAKETIQEFTSVITKKLKSSDDSFCSNLYLLLIIQLKSPNRPRHKSKEELPIRRQPLFKIINQVVEKGKSEGAFINEDTYKQSIAYLSLIQGISYNRCLCGYKRFICPSDETILNLLLKGDN